MLIMVGVERLSDGLEENGAVVSLVANNSVHNHILENQPQLQIDIQSVKPTHVFNGMGLTRKPNVDWCESHKPETIRTHVVGALNLVDICREQGLLLMNFATRCIFEYDNIHLEGNGVVSHNEILEMYRDYIDPNFKWVSFNLEEQAKVIVSPLPKIYDPISNKWRAIARLLVVQGVLYAGVVCNGVFYVSSEFDKLVAYAFEKGTWFGIQIAHFLIQFHEYFLKLVPCRGRLFMLGVSWCERDDGENGRDKAIRKLWELDLSSYSCTEISRDLDAPLD
eukprot:Gb_22981 [translate_table: standard]